MPEASISRRSLLKASAALCAISLVPLPVEACAAAIPDGYAAWIRNRERDGWTVSCASRVGAAGFSVFSTAASRVTGCGSAPVDVARKMILADFATKANLRPGSLSFGSGSLEGDGVRVPVSIWIDFA